MRKMLAMLLGTPSMISLSAIVAAAQPAWIHRALLK
jgi:hypothetical protein